jgi:hypothetical protein
MWSLCSGLSCKSDTCGDGMNWKNFFKPDRRKIKIMVILIILTGLTFPFILYFSPIIFTYIILIVGLPILIESVIPVKVVLLLIYWYFISCIISWVYDRYFKKVKKK